MSTTYSLVCHDCKKSLWIGQRGGGSRDFWMYDPNKNGAARFLQSHIGHRLGFVSDHDEGPEAEYADQSAELMSGDL